MEINCTWSQHPSENLKNALGFVWTYFIVYLHNGIGHKFYNLLSPLTKMHFKQYNRKGGLWIMMIANNRHQLKVCTNKWQKIVRLMKYWFYDKRVG